MSDDYINRADVLSFCGKVVDSHQSTQRSRLIANSFNNFAAWVKGLPAADVVERKKGEWMFSNSMTGYRCSLCKAQAPFWCMASTQNLSNYCPNCGADMRQIMGYPQVPGITLTVIKEKGES